MKYENTKMNAQNEYEMNTEYISEYLNINPSKMNEWIMYKTATEKHDIMNIASHSLKENENDDEYEYYKKGKKWNMCIQNENMGNYWWWNIWQYKY